MDFVYLFSFPGRSNGRLPGEGRDVHGRSGLGGARSRGPVSWSWGSRFPPPTSRRPPETEILDDTCTCPLYSLFVEFNHLQ